MLFYFQSDEFDPGNRGARSESILDANDVPHLIVDRPPALARIGLPGRSGSRTTSPHALQRLPSETRRRVRSTAPRWKAKNQAHARRRVGRHAAPSTRPSSIVRHGGRSPDPPCRRNATRMAARQRHGRKGIVRARIELIGLKWRDDWRRRLGQPGKANAPSAMTPMSIGAGGRRRGPGRWRQTPSFSSRRRLQGATGLVVQ